MDKLSKELPVVKDKLRAKFKAQGLNKDQIEIKMNSLDCEFCTHAFVNDIKLSSVEERLKFYLDFLKDQL
jgi:hypothetical protein